MAAATFENVKLTATPATVAPGSTATITVSGTATEATTSTVEVTVNLSTPDGATGSGTVPLTVTGSQQVAVSIVSASDPAGHTWTVAADGKSVSATV